MTKKILVIVLFLTSYEIAYPQTRDFNGKIENAKKEFEKGNYQKALVMFDDVISEAEKDSMQFYVSEIYLQRAECNIKLKSTNNVCKDLQTAIEFNLLEAIPLARENCPSLVNSKLEAQLVSKTASDYFWANDYAKAILYYTKAIELHPNELDIRGRAMSFHAAKQYDQELKDYSILIQVIPDNPDDYTSRGIAFFELKRFEEALADLNKAISLNPSDVIPYIHLGMIHNELKNYGEAIADFTKVLTEIKGSNIYLHRAKSYLGIGDKLKACKDLQNIPTADLTEEAKSLLKNCAKR